MYTRALSLHQIRGLGTDEPGIIPIFPGWNVWSVWQVKDLDFDPFMIGVTDERRLRIWVEDQIREKAGAAEVADPLALKGTSIQVLPSVPIGLKIMARKEQVNGCEGDGCAGPLMVVDGPATLKTVRFFNRSNSQTSMPWPHDDNYLVDSTYIPNVDNPITSGPGPGTILSSATTPISEGMKELTSTLTTVLVGGAVVYLAVMLGPPIIAMVQKRLNAKAAAG